MVLKFLLELLRKGDVVLPITEIVSENDFFDYEAKYEGKSQEITPARISEQSKEVSTIAKKIYQILKLKGFSRSEFIFVDNTPLPTRNKYCPWIN